MKHLISVAFLFHLAFMAQTFEPPSISLRVWALWPFYYILSHLQLLRLRAQLKSAFAFIPLAISMVLNTTFTEGIISSCLACTFFMKMQVLSQQEVLTYTDFRGFMWAPLLEFKSGLTVSLAGKLSAVLKNAVGAALIITWDAYFIQNHLSRVYNDDQGMLQFLLEYSYLLAILVVVNFHLFFDFVLGTFALVTNQAVYGVLYEDWWNAKGFSEFNRKWNKQVHLFLKFQVLRPLQRRTKHAMLLTYLATALLHEYCITVAHGRLRPVFLLMCFIQFPLIQFESRIPFQTYFLFAQILFGNSLMIFIYKK